MTLRGTLVDDGGDECRCQFIYWTYDDRRWQTAWVESQYSGAVLVQTIAGLVPETRYFYSLRAENSEEYDSGRTGTFVTLAEKVPPIPHPVVWTIDPDQIDTSSLIMMADIARDVSGPEEYIFDFVSSLTGGAGGSDSPWQFSPSYTDVGLNPNHQYGYRVKARDGLGNETAYSAVRYAYSAIKTPAGVAFGEITTSSIQAKSSNALSGLDRGESGLKLENVTASQVSAWQRENAFWTSDGLLPNTQYAFRAQARNGDADYTPFSPLTEIYTLATVPTATAFSNVTASSLLTHWGANGNPAGTQYWCANTTSSSNSGWITTAQWLDADLSPNVRYAYHVKARNGDAVETAFSATIEKYSAIENPEGIAFGAITTNSIQVRSENTPSGLDRAQSGLRFENLTAGRTSSWRRDNSFWNSDGLLPNRRYDFRAQARNGDGEQTPYGRTGSAYTHANVPTTAASAGITTRSIQVQWGPNGNPPGTLYLCDNATAGTSSGWTILTAWDNTGLQPNTQYTFRVKAQNAVGVETTFSAETRKYSAIETPTGVVFGAVMANSIQVRSENTPTGLDLGGSGLRFENVTTGELSAWQQNNGLWTSGALQPNTPYMFRAQARNGDGDETPYGLTNTTYTLANPPAPADFSNVTDTAARANWGPNGNPFGTLYRCQNVTSGADSGWTSATSWDSFDLTPFTTYSFRVKSRNANGIETGWVSLGQVTTGYRSLTVSSTAGGQVSSPGEDVFHYTPGTTANVAADVQTGYHFTHWSGSAADAGRVADPNASQTTVLVDAHYTLVANFLRTRIYVDHRAKGARDGSSWTNAFTSLQDALDIAQRQNQILVAQGLYTPDTGRNRTPGDYTVS
ncbi:MAG: fibronectin type III domain-containing protein, partial [Planctomycetota bacterium]